MRATTNRIGRFAVAACAVSAILAAQEAPQKIQVTMTQRLEFPANGVLHFANSIGALTVEAWDRPDVEITTTKSTRNEYDARGREQYAAELDRVRVTSERHGDELLIRTEFPRHRAFPPPSPLHGATSFDLEYRVSAPRNARLIVNHDVGEVNVDGLAGDIRITALQGELLLHLSGDHSYAVDARSDLGSVNSDFPGRSSRSRWLLGHAFQAEPAGSVQRLYLRIGHGDIVILRAHKPAPPTPAP